VHVRHCAIISGFAYSLAGVVKLVDAGDSKSPGATRPGSIPGSGTISFSAMDFVARFRIQFRADSAKRLSYALTKGIYRR
jgi:hypothetical protein